MVAQLTNAEASTFYTANSETSTSYTVNAEVSTFYMIMIDQVANIESSTFYTFTAKTSTSSALNAEFSTSYAVNVQPNSSYTIDTKTNVLCENAVYDEATTEEVNRDKTQHDFSLLKLGYTFPSWDDIEAFFKAYGQYHGFAIIKIRVEQRNDGVIRYRSLGCEFGGKYIPMKSIDINAYPTDNRNVKDMNDISI
ncbi:1913_t:CDS:2 [Dentiscutata heterogama]|uniref:1913_t:CDS:1 n=1 Tax=Dentiscutata heterogama TaxID=1316150 RepID=A0ACA9P631_9GLOM|nr:1913_t:CDS:2 [Dentiscutata heterogama]